MRRNEAEALEIYEIPHPLGYGGRILLIVAGLLFGVLPIVETAPMVFSGRAMAGTGRDDRPAIELFLMGAFILGVVAIGIRRLLNGPEKVGIGIGGIQFFNLMREPVPWDDVQSVTFRPRRWTSRGRSLAVIILTLKEGRRAKSYDGWRGLLSISFGGPQRFQVMLKDKISIDRLTDAIAKYKAVDGLWQRKL